MRNWLHIVHRALVDTWDIVVGQPLHAVIVAVIIFSLTVYFARLYRGNDFARDIHIDGNQVTLRDLAPAGKMSTTLDFQPDDSGTFKTALIVNFQSEIRGTNMNY